MKPETVQITMYEVIIDVSHIISDIDMNSKHVQSSEMSTSIIDSSHICYFLVNLWMHPNTKE